MIVLYPIILAGAAYLMFKAREREDRLRGWKWCAAWVVAGALFVFSFGTGLSIGLYLFPAAAFAVFWLATNAPYSREAAGFPLGAALVTVVLILANTSS